MGSKCGVSDWVFTYMSITDNISSWPAFPPSSGNYAYTFFWVFVDGVRSWELVDISFYNHATLHVVKSSGFWW